MRHLRHAFHDGSQSAVAADDGVHDVLAAEPREKRAVVSLDRLAQLFQLSQPTIVLDGDGERLEQRPQHRFVLLMEGTGRLGRQDQDA